MEKGSVIRTGVDRLLEVLKANGTLSLKAAAIKLGVSTAAVLEWAKMLEEEGLLRIRYKFSTAYLEPKVLASKEYHRIKKELQGRKEILDERLESTNHFLIALENEVKKLRDLFGDLGSNFSTNISKVQKNLKQLSLFETQKEKTDKKIIDSKARFLERLHEVEKHLSAKKQTAKQWFGLLYTEILRGGEILKIEENELRMIQENETMLEQKLADMRALLDIKVLKKITENEKEISKLRKILMAIQTKYLRMKEELMMEKAALQKLIDQNKKTIEQLEKEQNALVEKMRLSTESFQMSIEELEEMPQKMQVFFDKKSLVEGILNKIHFNETRLKQRLNALCEQSKKIEKEASLEDFKKELDKLQEGVKQLEAKREYFTDELRSLVALLKK